MSQKKITAAQQVAGWGLDASEPAELIGGLVGWIVRFSGSRREADLPAAGGLGN